MATSVLDMLSNEFHAYANNFVTVDLNFPEVPPGQQKWDVGDTASFFVRVKNTGHMDIKKLKLRLDAGEYGEIRRVSLGVTTPATPQWSASLTTAPLNIDAHRSKLIGPFEFKAKKETEGPEPQDVLCVRVSAFDLSWDHLLVDHTKRGTADCVPLVIYPK
ncbi:MAG: hypothetical protein ACRDGN_13895 [bacterium]